MSPQNATGGTGTAAGDGAVSAWDAIRSRRDVEAWPTRSSRQLLGFPEDKTCAFLIALGYPAGRPLAPIRRPDRRPFDEVVHWGRW